jgi:hypothetical protein
MFTVHLMEGMSEMEKHYIHLPRTCIQNILNGFLEEKEKERKQERKEGRRK